MTVCVRARYIAHSQAEQAMTAASDCRMADERTTKLAFLTRIFTEMCIESRTQVKEIPLYCTAPVNGTSCL